eukprot:1139538-Prorocentrum_minimum.AAC.1
MKRMCTFEGGYDTREEEVRAGLRFSSRFRHNFVTFSSRFRHDFVTVMQLRSGSSVSRCTLRAMRIRTGDNIRGGDGTLRAMRIRTGGRCGYVQVITYGGETVRAVVFTTKPNLQLERSLPPMRNYLKKLQTGARFLQLDEEYVVRAHWFIVRIYPPPA